MSDHPSTPAPVDENQLILERREKLKALRQQQAEGKGVAFPNDFKPTDHAADLFAAHAGQTPEGLIEQGATAKVAGRMMLKRVMGKASFATLQDGSGRIQLYIKGGCGCRGLRQLQALGFGRHRGRRGQGFQDKNR